MSLLNLFHHRLDPHRVGNITFDNQRIIQMLRDGFRVTLIFAFGIGNIVQDWARALCTESFNDFSSDSTRTASDKNHLAGKIQRILHVLDFGRNKIAGQLNAVKISRLVGPALCRRVARE